VGAGFAGGGETGGLAATIVKLTRVALLGPVILVLLFMGLGMVLGIIAPGAATMVEPLGDLFIRLLMMAAIPLVAPFASAVR
jgi:hypothetical protein